MATHVKRRRKELGFTIAAAATKAGLSVRKWYDIEGAAKNHLDLTLRAVARALDESPAVLLRLAGYPVDGDGSPSESWEPDPLAALARRVEALEVLPDIVCELRSEVSELVAVVRSVHHDAGSPDT